MSGELLLKYNRQGPRYTSYPPVPFWNNAPDEKKWIEDLKRNYDEEKGIDLYIHVPFCQKLCYYCGCNRIVTKNTTVQEKFVELLLMEWSLYVDKLGFVPLINSIHFGGGTPTFLSPSNLEKLIGVLTQKRSRSFKGSIEIDPRNTTIEHLDCFKKTGIERISLGIQDFDPEVQKAINRIQPFSLVQELMKEMRKRDFESINFDVIYGLPKQNTETIEKTFQLIRELGPDLIAYYSYAHLPEKLSNQRLINAEDLLTGEKKHELYELGKELLALDGYKDIGMDHFATEKNFLYQAKLNKRLHRNFMGYVDKKSNILLGLGPSSISDSGKSFTQNEKGLSDYEVRIMGGTLALNHGHSHSEMDLEVQRIILDLMCQNESLLNNAIPYWNEVVLELEAMEEDGLLTFKDQRIEVLPLGKKFLRNIAMSFDFYFREKNPVGKFSQTI